MLRAFAQGPKNHIMKINTSQEEASKKLIDFVNLVSTPEEMVRCIYDDPNSGGSKGKPQTISLETAQSILKQREQLTAFKSIEELSAIKGIGKDTLNDLLYSMKLYPLSAEDHIRLHDEQFRKTLQELNKDEYRSSDCTFCAAKKEEDCGCHEESTRSLSDPSSGVSISNPNTGIGVLNPGSGNPFASNPCSGTIMNDSFFAPINSTPPKNIRINLVIIQKEDGTANFNEFDPSHNNALNIAESECSRIYQNVHATGTGNTCNTQADSRVRFDFRRIYVRDSELWNIDENWTRNNGNPITPFACPNLSANWPWRDLYFELRDQEECKDEAITIFLVNSGIYLNDIQSQLQYFEQPAGSPQWLVPSPNYTLTNWSGHSPWVGGCSILPSTNPHNTNRGHVILCKNSYYDYIRVSRLVRLNGGPTNADWHIGTGLGSLLAHELGHLIMSQHHTQSGGCGTNLMNNGGWQQYLNTSQLARLHRVLSTTDLRRTVQEDHPRLEVITNETWDRSVKMFGDIIIRTGNTLTVTCELEMPANGRIIVERGARLDVIDGTITSRCLPWGSIEVHGNASNPHPAINDIRSGGYPSSKKDHGVVYLENATIENAAHAITTVRQETWGANLNFGGGIVIANETTFRNVKRAVEFMKYDYENVSRFSRCTFETDPTADLYFDHHLLAFVTMWAVKGIQFLGNTFINRDAQGAIYGLGERGRGIYSINASYSVKPIKHNGSYLRNEFINLTTAIGSDSSTHFNSNLVILHTLFDNCYQGINLRGITGARIGFMECQIGSELSNIGEQYAYGIRVESGRLIAIENSQFTNALNSTGSQYGVLMQNCIDGFNWVYGCTFSSITAGVRAGGKNNWLLVKCNRFDTRVGDMYLDRDFASQTPGEIGVIQSFHPSLGPANNQFTASTNNCAHVGHHIHFDAFASQSFFYLLPAAIAGSSYVPTCIINGSPNIFQTGFNPYCPKSIAQSKKLKLKSTDDSSEQFEELMKSLSKEEQLQVEMLAKVSNTLDASEEAEIDLNKMYESLSQLVQIGEAEKVISEITQATSSDKQFKMTEAMRDQIHFLQTIGSVAQARLDSLNALENLLA